MYAWEHLQVSRESVLSFHLNHSTRYETSGLNQCAWSKPMLQINCIRSFVGGLLADKYWIMREYINFDSAYYSS